MARGTGRTERTIKSVRESLDMTVPEFALRTGLTEQRVRWLESQIEQPSSDEVSKIADALNVLPDDLVAVGSLHQGSPKKINISS